MASLNSCTFIGNLGRDPEVRYAASGDAMCNISIACSEKWKDKNTGEQKEVTEWINISFFGKLAEIVGQYCKKGSSIYVEGRMTTRKYTDKDGVEKYATSIKGDKMLMLGGRQDGDSGQQQAPAPQQQRQAAPQQQGGAPRPQQQRQPAPMDDDIPF